jgi:hypothetical protein
MKVAAFGLLALLAGGAQAQTVGYNEPYSTPLVSVAAPSLYIPSLDVPALNTPPLFVPPLQNGRGQGDRPSRRGGSVYGGYAGVGSGGIGYESPGAYPRDRQLTEGNINRTNTTRGRSASFNPGGGDPTFNPAGIRSAGFSRRR